MASSTNIQNSKTEFQIAARNRRFLSEKIFECSPEESGIREAITFATIVGTGSSYQSKNNKEEGFLSLLLGTVSGKLWFYKRGEKGIDTNLRFFRIARCNTSVAAAAPDIIDNCIYGVTHENKIYAVKILKDLVMCIIPFEKKIKKRICNIFMRAEDELWVLGYDKSIDRFKLSTANTLTPLKDSERKLTLPILPENMFFYKNEWEEESIIFWNREAIFTAKIENGSINRNTYRDMTPGDEIRHVRVENITNDGMSEIVIVLGSGKVLICHDDLIPIYSFIAEPDIATFTMTRTNEQVVQLIFGTRSGHYVVYDAIGNEICKYFLERGSMSCLSQFSILGKESNGVEKTYQYIIIGFPDGSFDIQKTQSAQATVPRLNKSFMAEVRTQRQKNSQNPLLEEVDTFYRLFQDEPISVLHMIPRFFGVLNVLIQRFEEIPKSVFQFFNTVFQLGSNESELDAKLPKTSIGIQNLRNNLEKELLTLSAEVRRAILENFDPIKDNFFPVSHRLINILLKQPTEITGNFRGVERWKNYDRTISFKNSFNNENRENWKHILQVTGNIAIESLTLIGQGDWISEMPTNETIIFDKNKGYTIIKEQKGAEDRLFERQCIDDIKGEIIFLIPTYDNTFWGSFALLTVSGHLQLLKSNSRGLLAVIFQIDLGLTSPIKLGYIRQEKNGILIAVASTSDEGGGILFYRLYIRKNRREGVEYYLTKLQQNFDIREASFIVAEKNDRTHFLIGTLAGSLFRVSPDEPICRKLDQFNLPFIIDAICYTKRESKIFFTNRNKLFYFNTDNRGAPVIIPLEDTIRALKIVHPCRRSHIKPDELLWVLAEFSVFGINPISHEIETRRFLPNQSSIITPIQLSDKKSGKNQFFAFLRNTQKERQYLAKFRYYPPESFLMPSSGRTIEPRLIFDSSLSHDSLTIIPNCFFNDDGLIDVLGMIYKSRHKTQTYYYKDIRNVLPIMPDDQRILIFWETFDGKTRVKQALEKLNAMVPKQKVVLLCSCGIETIEKVGVKNLKFTVKSPPKFREPEDLTRFLIAIEKKSYVSKRAEKLLWNLTKGEFFYISIFLSGLKDQPILHEETIFEVLSKVLPTEGTMGRLIGFLNRQRDRVNQLLLLIIRHVKTQEPTNNENDLVELFEVNKENIALFEKLRLLVTNGPNNIEGTIQLAPFWREWILRYPAPLEEIGKILLKTLINKKLPLNKLVQFEADYFEHLPLENRINNAFFQDKWFPALDLATAFGILSSPEKDPYVLRSAAKELLKNYSQLIGAGAVLNDDFEVQGIISLRLGMRGMSGAFNLAESVVVFCVPNSNIEDIERRILAAEKEAENVIIVAVQKIEILNKFKKAMLVDESVLRGSFKGDGQADFERLMLKTFKLSVRAGYQPGGAILPSQGRPFYGREHFLKEVPQTFEHWAFVGARRIGKSSLLLRIRERIVITGRDIYYLDCSNYKDPDTFLKAFLKMLGREVCFEEWSEEQLENTRNAHHVFNETPVIILDEYDGLAQWEMDLKEKSEFAEQQVISWKLRSLAQQGAIQLIIAGFWIVNHCLNNTFHPFFNLFSKKAYLGAITPEAQHHLMVDPMEMVGVTYHPEALKKLKECCLGSPYIIQQMGYLLLEKLDSLGDSGSREIIAEHVDTCFNSHEIKDYFREMIFNGVRRPILKKFILTHLKQEEITLRAIKEWFSKEEKALPSGNRVHFTEGFFPLLWRELLISGLFRWDEGSEIEVLKFLNSTVLNLIRNIIDLDLELNNVKNHKDSFKFDEL